MATGSISSLGVGSNLQLQDIIDQLRKVDEQAVTLKKDKQTEYKAQLEEFTLVKNNLFSLKSAALDLSLSSTYLNRTVSSSEESTLTATVADGAAAQSATIKVDRLATKSSWLSTGTSSKDNSVAVPTTFYSTTGAINPAQADFITQDQTLSLAFGSGDSAYPINVGVTAGMSMNDVATAINSDPENQGGPGDNGRYVTAETFLSEGQSFLRIRTDTTGGSGENNRITLSQQLTGVTFAASAKTFAYKVGDDTITINVAADTTLTELASLINTDTDNPGVTASVIDDGNATAPFRLLLQSDATGEDGRISIPAPLPDVALTEQNGANSSSLNASVTVEGIAYQRQDNTMSDLLSGITLTIKGTGSSTVSTANNDDKVKGLIASLVKAYNDVTQEVQKNIAFDKNTNAFGILARTTIRDLPFDMESLMTTTVKADSTGTINSLFDLGMEFNRDSTITINEEVLAAAIADHPEEVKAFFLGDEDNDITGMADIINEKMRTLTGGTGQIEAEKTAAQGRIDSLKIEMETMTARLDKKYEIMTKQFVELDRYMRQMTSVADFLTNQFNSMSSTASGQNGK